jgi:flagellar assembly protein FliH
MSSKILRGGTANAAPAMVWRRVGGAAPSPAPDAPAAWEASPDISALRRRITELEADLARREAQAREAGLREGRSAAEKRLTQPLEEALGRVAAQLAELASLRARLRREAEGDLVRLAVEIARRILRRELAADPEAILGVVKAALDRVDSREVLRVRASAADAETIRAHVARRNLPDRIEIIADAGLERGALLVETARGVADASVETQLQEIERGLTDLVRRKPA